MTAVSAKKVEGKIEEINPTTILVAKKTIYLPPEKRAEFTALDFKEQDEVRIVYDMKGNYINGELLKHGELKEIQKTKFVPAKIIDSDAEQAKKLHINPQKVVEPLPAKTGVSDQNMHIQQEIQSIADIVKANPEVLQEYLNEKKENQRVIGAGGGESHTQFEPEHPKPEIQKDWITGKEKNDAIILQSVLARSVEIVNSLYLSYPEINQPKSQNSFEDMLDTRCNHIENITDRLFSYVKRKIEQERVK